jgi:alkyl sulfatase BDS1-like metallo-beta-lactamase superfamily hydrolase
MDDIAATISLPDHLVDKPWLGEFYGKLSWSARAYAVGILGWYDGNPTHLEGLSSRSRAEKIAALAGGFEGLWDVLKNDDDPQWKLEVCDHLIALDQPAEAQKAELLTTLAETEINATARNTYLWEAKQLLSRISEGSDT